MYEITEAVSTGICSLDLASRSPGPISHARWLTTANRILRLYVGTDEPSSELVLLSEFIVKVYSVGWFTIKMNPSCFDGSKNLWSIIKNSRYLPLDLRSVVDSVISRNAYFAHPENILIGMLADEREHIRALATKRIAKVRSERSSTSTRQFVIPDINFNADDYIDLIDWQKCELTEPPATVSLSRDQLSSLVNMKNNVKDLPCYKFPCNTQAVERSIKIVSEASQKVCGAERREGYVRATLASRRKMNSFQTKSNYKLH